MPYLIEGARCSSCKKEFRAVLPEKVGYYFCDNITCKIKVLVEMREENPLEYGINSKDLQQHYGNNWKNIIRNVIDN